MQGSEPQAVVQTQPCDGPCLQPAVSLLHIPCRAFESQCRLNRGRSEILQWAAICDRTIVVFVSLFVLPPPSGVELEGRRFAPFRLSHRRHPCAAVGWACRWLISPRELFAFLLVA